MITKPSEKESSRETARGTIDLLVGRVLFMISGYVITVILARTLGPAAYGIYGVIMSLLLWLEVVSGMGIPPATVKLIPEREDSTAVAQTASAMLLCVSLLLFALCWVSAPYVAHIFRIDDGTRLFRIAIIDLPFNGLFLAYKAVIQGLRQFGMLSLSLIIYSVAKLTGIAALLVVGMTIEMALIVNVLATVTALIFLFVRYRPGVSFSSWPLFKSILHLAAPLSIVFTFNQLLQWAHLWLLKYFSNTTDDTIGSYVAALNLARLPTVVQFVLSGIVLASISYALSRNDRALAQRYVQAATRFILILLTPVCVLGAMDATPIMAFVFSESYADGGSLLALLLIAFGFFALFDTTFHFVIAAGDVYKIVWLLVVLVPLTVLFSSLLIPTWGAEGAAAAFTLTLALGTFAAALIAYREYDVFVKRVTLLRVGLSTAVAAVVSSKIPALGIWLLLKLPILMLLYLLILTLLRELSNEDLKPLAVWNRN